MDTHRQRIQLHHSLVDIVSELSEGNPGAINVMMLLFQESHAIDPQNCMGPFGALMNLDSIGIYGPNIWILYKNLCGGDIVSVVAVLRAVQLGILDRRDLRDSLDAQEPRFNRDFILATVRERLPEFKRAEEPATASDGKSA